MLDTQTFDKPLGGFSRDAPAPNDPIEARSRPGHVHKTIVEQLEGISYQVKLHLLPNTIAIEND
jgi:hypothetical protein